MVVSAADFRTNMSEYFLHLSEEDIYITRHGKIVAVVTDPEREERKRALETSEMHLMRGYLEKIVQLMEEIKAAVT